MRVSGLRFPLHTFSEVAPSALWLNCTRMQRRLVSFQFLSFQFPQVLGGHSSNVPLGSSKHPFVSGVCHWCSSCNDTPQEWLRGRRCHGKSLHGFAGSTSRSNLDADSWICAQAHQPDVPGKFKTSFRVTFMVEPMKRTQEPLKNFAKLTVMAAIAGASACLVFMSLDQH